MALINCPECGREISDKTKSCPYCGYPIAGEPESAPVNVEVSKINVLNSEKSKSTVKRIIIGSLVVLVLVLGVIIFSKYNAKKNWEKNYTTAVYSMLSGAADAESAGNMIKSVWYNTIFKIKDDKTDIYCIKTGSSNFYDDFNDALVNYVTSSEYKGYTNSINSYTKTVEKCMIELRNPPKEFEEPYELVKDLYDLYYDMTELVLKPSGSLSSFSEKFMELDDDVLKAFNKAKKYVFE